MSPLKHSKLKQYSVRRERELTKLCSEENTCDEDLEKIVMIKKELDKWYTMKCKGAFVKSQEKWIEQGENCTKYFLQL